MIKIPIVSLLAEKLYKSYFDFYNLVLEKKIRKKRILLRLKRLSSNKIFLSFGEFKHTNNKVVVNIYLFNRQKLNYKLKFKRNYFKTFKFYDNKLKIKFNKIAKKGIFSIFGKNNKINLSIKKSFGDHNVIKYLTFFYKKFLKKKMFKLNKYIYLKQLIFLNKSKYNYMFLSHLKKHLELNFNKNVEFNLVDLKRFYSNSDILSNAIKTKITKNRRKLSRFLNKLRKKVKVKKIFSTNKTFKLEKNRNLLRSYIFFKLEHKTLSGFRLEAAGRLTKRYTASRSRYVFKYKGNLADINSSIKGLSSVMLKGNLKPNIQYTKLNSKTRIGSFGVKG